MKTTQTLRPGQSTVSGSPNTRKTNKPPDNQGQTGSNNSSKTNTAAIVAPIMVILIIGIGVGVGLVLYRRRQNPRNLEILTPDGAMQSSTLTFGRGGVVRFMNRIRGQKREEGSMSMGGVNNPGYETQGISNPGYDTAAAVFAEDHADYGSEA